MTKGDEEKLAQILIPDIERVAKNYELQAGDKIKVVSDFTCLKEEDKFRFNISFSEVDIAIYKKTPFEKNDKGITNNFNLYRDSPHDKDFLRIPFVILELKSGSTTVDSIRARNEVARKIRNIFPYCAYIFIAENTSKKEETLFRHGKDFNNFFIFNDFLNKSNKEYIITEFIEPFLDNLKKIDLI